MGQARPKRTWQDTFREDMQYLCVSDSDIHDELEVLPATLPDGDNLSPSVPTATGGPKTKSS